MLWNGRTAKSVGSWKSAAINFSSDTSASSNPGQINSSQQSENDANNTFVHSMALTTTNWKITADTTVYLLLSFSGEILSRVCVASLVSLPPLPSSTFSWPAINLAGRQWVKFTTGSAARRLGTWPSPVSLLVFHSCSSVVLHTSHLWNWQGKLSVSEWVSRV